MVDLKRGGEGVLGLLDSEVGNSFIYSVVPFISPSHLTMQLIE